MAAVRFGSVRFRKFAGSAGSRFRKNRSGSGIDRSGSAGSAVQPVQRFSRFGGSAGSETGSETGSGPGSETGSGPVQGCDVPGIFQGILIFSSKLDPRCRDVRFSVQNLIRGVETSGLPLKTCSAVRDDKFSSKLDPWCRDVMFSAQNFIRGVATSGFQFKT